jgi:hypothetical protein
MSGQKRLSRKKPATKDEIEIFERRELIVEVDS